MEVDEKSAKFTLTYKNEKYYFCSLYCKKQFEQNPERYAAPAGSGRPPKIVVANPIYLPDEYRSRLEALGELKVYSAAPESVEDFKERIGDADIVVTGRYCISGDVILSSQRLKMISLWQTGYDNVDLGAAEEHGVVVTNVPGYSFDSVAEFVFAMALDLLRHVRVADARLRQGKSDWRCYVGRQLMGKTMGVIGLGKIGMRVIQIAQGLNMNVICNTSHPSPEREKTLGVKFVDLDTILRESDVVSLHVPLTPETEHMIGAAELAKMKPSAILINTARGKIIDEAALAEALKDKMIAGAGLDVFEREPLPLDSPLVSLKNVILTPHIAFLSEEAMDELTYVCVENVEMFLKGTPQNVVNSSASEGAQA
jgi:D-3-phosphoglycerate dehydrogenase